MLCKALQDEQLLSFFGDEQLLSFLGEWAKATISGFGGFRV